MIPIRVVTPALVAILACSTGASAQEEEQAYQDDRFDFSATVPAPWAEAPLDGFAVPGTARQAWSGPEGASIVAFVQEPGQAFTPRFLVDESAKAMTRALGATIDEKEVKTIAGKQAMSLLLTAKGTGSALGGGGEVETTQHWIAVPREEDIIVLLLTTPTSRYEGLKPSFQKAIESLEVGGTQTAEQQASK